MSYLEHNPETSYISLCLDNDDAGKNAADKIHAIICTNERYSGVTVTIDLPIGVKDYNDALLQATNMEREQKHNNQKHEAVSSLQSYTKDGNFYAKPNHDANHEVHQPAMTPLNTGSLAG